MASTRVLQNDKYMDGSSSPYLGKVDEKSTILMHPASNHANKTLCQLYQEMFETVVADTDDLIDECYKLRYQVFCEEHSCADYNFTAGEYERDAFDGRALHGLLRHRKSGEFIGAVRLILHDEESPQPLPFFQLCDENHVFVPDAIRSNISFEISRGCMAKSFRRRVTDGLFPATYAPREMAMVHRRVMPCMALGLIKMVADWNKQHNLAFGCASEEPSLLRLLGTLGFHFKAIGQPVEHHGTRHLVYGNFNEVLNILAQERPDIYEMMNQ